MHAVRLKNLNPKVALITILGIKRTKMFQGSSSRSPQPSASNRRKEVREEWLPDFFPEAHILSVSYSACARIFDLYLLGENLISDLLQGGIGQIPSCPVILVGHCVGGLVIKETCCQAHYKLYSNKAPTNHKEKLGKFLRNIRGVFYYSTPHHGSSGVVKAATGPLFKYFGSLYDKAERLNSEFEDVGLSYEWLIFGLGASPPFISWRGFWNCLGNILFNHSNEVEVPEASSRQGNHFLIVIANHSSICQPRSRIDKRFYHLKTLVDNIVTTLQGEGEAQEETDLAGAHHQTLQKGSHTGLVIPTSVLNNEQFYVPIQSSHNEVIREIEKPEGVHVILLHGGVGKGKSTLARYMYERYGKDGENGNLFEHVIWLSCAKCSVKDTCNKQYEVLADHSPNSLGDTLPQEKSSLSSRVATAFQHFVVDKNILIILDDVSDPRFLFAMWEVVKGSKHVKYLVTSQRSNICCNLKNDSFCIAMGDPTEEEAKAILASHVRLEGKVIPEQLQGIAKDMIEITEGNPLALACLASHFDYSQDNEDKRAWQGAFRDLEELLDSAEVNIVIGNTESAPRSLCAAMKICIESLDTDDAKNILSLIYACKGELVPEIVLRLWHTSMKTRMKTSRSPFMKSLDELRMRELVKRNSGKTAARTTDMQGMGQNDDTEQLTTMWSLRSLVKLYMQQNMVGKGEIRSLIGELLGSEESTSDLSVGWEGHFETEENQGEKRRVAIALCALYFDRQHIDGTHAMTRAGIASNTTDFYDNVHDLRRKAVEPIIWMLDKPVEEGKWTHSDVQCVRKVLLTYICNHQLEDVSISHLLKLDVCTPAQLATLKVIGDICVIEEKPLFTRNNLNFLQAIVHLLRFNEGFPTQVQEEAIKTLRRICWKAREENSTLGIVDTPGVLQVLVSSLASSHLSDMVRAYTAGALASLANSQSVSIQLRIANQEDVLVRLVDLLSAHHNSSLPERAALVLQNLAGCADNHVKLRIADEEGAVAGLVKCLVLYDRPDLQEKVLNTLANLAHTDHIRLIIVDQVGALNALMKLLSADNAPAVQIAAVEALLCLSGTKDNYLKLRIAKEVGLVDALVKCLVLYDRPDLQEWVANALASLAHSDPVRRIIANEEGVLTALKNLVLAANSKPEGQIAATGVLLNLSATEDNNLKLRVAKEEGVVAALVKCLVLNKLCIGIEERVVAGLVKCPVSYDCPYLEGRVAKTLAHLAYTDPIRWAITNEEGALNALVKLFFAHNKPEVQIAGAEALLNLSATKDNKLRLRIANEKGLVAGLVKYLLYGRPDLQKRITNTLENLAHTNPVRWTIAKEQGALNGLVNLLFAENNPELQTAAAGAIVGLSATTDNDLQLLIAKEERALKGLMECIMDNDYPEMQENAMRALANLASTVRIQTYFLNEKGALASLLKIVFAHKKPKLQCQAGRALHNLAVTGDNHLRLHIANEEGAITGLVECLALSDRPDLQERVAVTLANLAHIDPIRSTIAKEEGALKGLAKLLVAEDNPKVQTAAAGVIVGLSATDDNDLQLLISEEADALENLMKCVIDNDHPELQEYATMALANLAGTMRIQTYFLNDKGALASLSKVVSAHEKPKVQCQGGRALHKLAVTGNSFLKLRIAGKEGALAGLVTCLALYDRPDLQKRVTNTLANLAHTDHIRWTVANEKGALKGLVELLFADNKPDVQTAAARAIVVLSNTNDNFLLLHIAKEEGALEHLMKCVIDNDCPELQEYATMALANLAGTMRTQTYFLNDEGGALASLSKVVSAAKKPKVQCQAGRALHNLAVTGNNSLKLRIAKEEGAIAGLVMCLALYDCPDLQKQAAMSLWFLAQFEEAKSILEGNEGLLMGLSSLLADGVPPETQYIGAGVLTFINPLKGQQASLTSARAYRGRADAFILMGMYTESLSDLGHADDLVHGADLGNLRLRCFVKSKLGDLEGALADANEAINVSDSHSHKAFSLQERGVVKRMMGNLEGALADLDEGLKLETDDYERLKHRGYVKFLLGDEDGARTDAEWALRIKPPGVDQLDDQTGQCLGVSPVEYLGYKLK